MGDGWKNLVVSAIECLAQVAPASSWHLLRGGLEEPVPPGKHEKVDSGCLKREPENGKGEPETLAPCA